MLQSLRSRSGKIFIVFICSLLVLSLVATGIIGVVKNYHAARSVAKIGNKSIHFDLYVQEIERVIREIRSKNPEITMKEIKNLNIFNSVLDQKAHELALAQELEKHKIFIPNDAIEGVIRSFPAFQKEGVFRPNLFFEYLQSARLQEGVFAARIRKHLMTHQLFNAMTGGMNLPEAYLEQLITMLFTEHKFDFMEIPFKKIKLDSSLTESDIENFYQKNKKKYEIPEKRDVQILSFDDQTIKKRIVVAEEDIKLTYEQNKDKFQEPETRHIERIAYPSKSMTNSAYEYLKNGGNLSDVFVKIPGGTYKDFGFLSKEQAPQEFQGRLFSAKKAEMFVAFSSKTKENVLFVISDIKKSKIKTFNETKKILREEIQSERLNDYIDKFKNEVEDDLASGKSFAYVAQKYNLSLNNSSVDLAGSGLSFIKKEIQDALKKDIFKLLKDQTTPVREMDSGFFVVMRLRKIEPSYIPNQEKIKTELRRDLILEKQKEKAKHYVRMLSKLSRKEAQKKAKNSFTTHNLEARPIDLLTGKTKLRQDVGEYIFCLKNQEVFDFSDEEKITLVWHIGKKTLANFPKEAQKIKEHFFKNEQVKLEIASHAIEKTYKKEIYKDVVEEAYEFFK